MSATTEGKDPRLPPHEMSATRRLGLFPILVVGLTVAVLISVGQLETVSKEFDKTPSNETVKSLHVETTHPSTGTKDDGDGDDSTLVMPEHPSKVVHEPTTMINTSESSSNPNTTRWTAEQFQQYLMQEINHTSNQRTKTSQELIHLVPKPIGDAVEIYNREAWYRLRTLLWELEQDTNTNRTNSSASKVVLCSMGGSVTAGGGVKGIPPALRWDRQFVDMIHITQQQQQQQQLSSSTSLRDIQVVNRGHGDRGSVQSAFLYHSFVPPDTDVIVWEFSTNDSNGYGRGCETANNAIITFLNQVVRASFSNNKAPPLVVLLYVWDPRAFRDPLPQQWRGVPAATYDYHTVLAADYDFVVGAVNLASYVNHLDGWTPKRVRDLFVSDFHHPNIRGHWMMGYLLWDLVIDDQRTERMTSFPDSRAKSTSQRKQPVLPLNPEYNCPFEPHPQQRVYQMLQDHSALASWTGEIPVNANITYGMLNPRRYHSSDANTNSQSSPSFDNNLTMALHEKADPMRQDRKMSLVLPCCEHGDRVSFHLSLSINTTTTGRNTNTAGSISAVAVTLFLDGERKEDLWNYLQVDWWDADATEIVNWTTTRTQSEDHRNDDNFAAAGPEWTVLSTKRCPMVDGNLFSTWLVMPPSGILPQEFRLDRLDLCSRYPRCQDPKNPRMGLLNLVLF